MTNYERMLQVVGYLKNDFNNLTYYQALDIAIKLVGTEVISDGLLVTENTGPVALEAIAMTLGYEKNGSTLKDVISNLKE